MQAGEVHHRIRRVKVSLEDVNTGETLGLSCYRVVGDPGQDSVYQPAEPPLVVGVTPSAADMIGVVVRAERAAGDEARSARRPAAARSARGQGRD
jgi:hypothetical protein